MSDKQAGWGTEEEPIFVPPSKSEHRKKNPNWPFQSDDHEPAQDENGNAIFYHVTDGRNIDSVMEKGLLPWNDSPGGSDLAPKRKDVVWLSATVEGAQRHWLNLYNERRTPSTDPKQTKKKTYYFKRYMEPERRWKEEKEIFPATIMIRIPAHDPNLKEERPAEKGGIYTYRGAISPEQLSLADVPAGREDVPYIEPDHLEKMDVDQLTALREQLVREWQLEKDPYQQGQIGRRVRQLDEYRQRLIYEKSAPKLEPYMEEPVIASKAANFNRLLTAMDELHRKNAGCSIDEAVLAHRRAGESVEDTADVIAQAIGQFELDLGNKEFANFKEADVYTFLLPRLADRSTGDESLMFTGDPNNVAPAAAPPGVNPVPAKPGTEHVNDLADSKDLVRFQTQAASKPHSRLLAEGVQPGGRVLQLFEVTETAATRGEYLKFEFREGGKAIKEMGPLYLDDPVYNEAAEFDLRHQAYEFLKELTGGNVRDVRGALIMASELPAQNYLTQEQLSALQVCPECNGPLEDRPELPAKGCPTCFISWSLDHTQVRGQLMDVNAKKGDPKKRPGLITWTDKCECECDPCSYYQEHGNCKASPQCVPDADREPKDTTAKKSDRKDSGKGFSTETLEDGIVSFDCNSCGHSDLEEERAQAHQRSKHGKKEAQVDEAEKQRRIALVREQVTGMRLTAAQKDVLASIEHQVMSFRDDFLESVGSLFRAPDWDPGSNWEVVEADGRAKLIRHEMPKLADDAPASQTKHAFRPGQKLRIWSSLLPEDVIVRECSGDFMYKVQSQYTGNIFTVAEDVLYDPTMEEGMFDADLQHIPHDLNGLF